MSDRPDTRICPKCGRAKFLSAFLKKQTTKKITTWCAECRRAKRTGISMRLSTWLETQGWSD